MSGQNHSATYEMEVTLVVYTLLDAKYEGDKVRLYYLPESGKIEEYIDRVEYYPYFYCLKEDKPLLHHYAIYCFAAFLTQRPMLEH